MPVIEVTDYNPPLPFRNGHFNTIYPPFFRKQTKVKFTRKRINTSDGDFLDIDLLTKEGNTNAVFLFHGLEGSTDSQYIQAAAKELHAIGFDIIATNFRGCSGTPNLKVTSYHSGFTDDLAFVLEHFSHNYKTTAIVAYSLGGNVSLKYLGQNPSAVHPKLSTVIVVSVPVHLSDGSRVLEKGVNYFYTQNFLKTLRQKAVEKDKQFPGTLNLENLKKVKTIWDFDEYFTAPMSLQFIADIKVDTHIISSLDDPFLSDSCYPFAEAKKSRHINFYPVKYGGHVGFYQKGGIYWIESKLIDILNKI